MAMKFPGDRGDIVTIRGKGPEAQLYYLESLKITKTMPVQEQEKVKETQRKETKGKQKLVRRDEAVMMTDLDPRGELQHERPEPEGDSVEIQLGSEPDHVVKLGKNLPINVMKNMIKVLQDNKDIFALVASDMPGVDPEFCCHRLAIKEGARPFAHKKRRMGQEQTTTIEK
jgi:hypothetical protein